jgi:hypothetical protein
VIQRPCFQVPSITSPLFRARAHLAVIVLALVLPARGANAQESKSAVTATELVKLLDQMKLDSVAAQQDGQFVSALYLPGSQLLVVRGRFASAERATVLIERKMYRDVYTDLNSAAEAATKVFVSDLGANGLRFRRESNQPFDTADVAGKSYRFDGEWGKAKLSREDYTKAYQTADEQYNQMLQALIAELKKPS